MTQYPKWLYHKTEKPKIVKSEAEHKEAGKGWEEAPHVVEIATVDFSSMTVVQLKEALISKGINESELSGLKKDELIAKLGAK